MGPQIAQGSSGGGRNATNPDARASKMQISALTNAAARTMPRWDMDLAASAARSAASRAFFQKSMRTAPNDWRMNCPENPPRGVSSGRGSARVATCVRFARRGIVSGVALEVILRRAQRGRARRPAGP